MATRVGPKMARVVSFVETNPGFAMMHSARAVGPQGSLKYGYATVHRAIDAGLVWAVRGNGQVRLYPLARPCAVHDDCASNVGLAIECTKAVA